MCTGRCRLWPQAQEMAAEKQRVQLRQLREEVLLPQGRDLRGGGLSAIGRRPTARSTTTS